MTTQTNGALPPLAIPRITPPQGERSPLHTQPVAALPLEPALVPNPPLRPEDIPRMPKPVAAAPAQPTPATAPRAPWYVLPDAAYPASDTPTAEQVLWCLARFPLDGPEGVRATWTPAVGAETFSSILDIFQRETSTYAQELAAYEVAKKAATPPVAQVVTNPPQPETKTLPLGSTVVYTPAPVPAVLQQPGALAIGAKWAIHGTAAEIVRFGATTHNPLEQEVFLKTEAGHEHVTQVKFLASPTSGWSFLQPPATAASTAPTSSSSDLDAAAIAAVHHDAPVAQGTVQQQAAQAQQASGEAKNRRLGAAAKTRCLELHAQGKTKTEIAQATGLPMELVERALASVPSVQEQSQAAEKAYQQTLALGGTEQQARVASTQAIEQAVVGAIIADQAGLGTPAPNKRVLSACIVAGSLERGLSAYSGAGSYLDQLKAMQAELSALIETLEGRTP